MIRIKFSHVYKKMPDSLAHTYLKDLAVIHYNDLTPEEIKEDTETVDCQFYQLPKTKLIWLKLWTEGKEWGTIRRWTPEKFDYYSSHVGEEVRIVVE